MIGPDSPLALGSQSPRRREILEQLRIAHRVVRVDVDETARPAELPHAYVERIVAAKADAVRDALAAEGAPSAFLVADTLVTRDARIFGKPTDDADAREMLSVLAGATHEVITRFHIEARTGKSVARSVVTEVSFRALNAEEIERYVASGEGRDKAGSYAVQGLGAFLVASIRGSYTGVVGLPAAEVVAAAQELALLGAYP